MNDLIFEPNFKQFWAFFAFSNSQFEEKRDKTKEYISLWAWLICPKDTKEELKKYLNEWQKWHDKRMIEKYWIDRIIKYQLNNHECFYTWDIEDVLFLIDQYGCTKDDIIRVYKQEKKNFIDLY